MRPVLSTYRLQLSRDFTFHDAIKQVPYLRDLGTTHVYLSPILTAVPGSTHGYNGIDPTTVNPELGGEAGFRELVRVLRENGMGAILDIVPNHLDIEHPGNALWQDLLRHGRGSKFASYFDIDFDFYKKHPTLPHLDQKIVLPSLGDTPENVLHNKREGDTLYQLDLVYNDKHGFHFDYWGKVFPLSERSVEGLQAQYPGKDGSEICEAIRADEDHRFEILSGLLSEQHYALYQWREGLKLINYRRFFDVPNLGAVCVDRGEVFDAVHAKIQELVKDGLVDGLRVDHPDGLQNPTLYFEMLRDMVKTAGYPDIPIFAEKILHGHRETLPESWEEQIDGTTGYEFLAALERMYLGSGLASLEEIYRAFVGDRPDTDPVFNPDDLSYECRKYMLENVLFPEYNWISRLLFDALGEKASGHKPANIQKALTEVLLHFPVYRTYITPDFPSQRAESHIEAAIQAAQARDNNKQLSLEFELIRNVLVSAIKNKAEYLFTARLQQVTGPLAGTGEENTMFFRYNLLRGLCEVGQSLQDLKLTPDGFFSWLSDWNRSFPRSMRASSTHDTKLGEDVRARINALEQIPEEWKQTVFAWKDYAAKYTVPGADGQGTAPDLNEQYHIFQVIVGSVPNQILFSEGEEIDPETLESYVSRVAGSSTTDGYVIKALREAKVHTTWIDQKPQYEGAVCAFTRSLLEDRSFLKEQLLPFARKLAFFGAQIRTSQDFAKAFLGGIPDTYQGAEVSNLSLTDPDNRRPVDFDGLKEQLEGGKALPVSELSSRWQDGTCKQQLTAGFNAVRNEHPDLFMHGKLRKLPVYEDGNPTERVIAFARQDNRGKTAIVVLPRRFAFNAAASGNDSLGLGDQANRYTVELLAGLKGRTVIRDALDSSGRPVPLSMETFADNPTIQVPGLRYIPGAILIAEPKPK